MSKDEKVAIGFQLLLALLVIFTTAWLTSAYIIKTLEVNTTENGYEVTIFNEAWLYN